MKVMVYFNSMSAAGGIERVIASHITFMNETCHVTLVTKDSKASFFPLPKAVGRGSLDVDFTMDMKSRWRRIARILTSLFWTILALRRQFKKLDPDVVYVASPLNLLEVLLAGMNGRRILVTEHSSFSAYNSIYKKIISKFYPRVGLLTVPTKMDSEGYSMRGIRNTYVPNPLSFYPNESADLSGKRVLCVGRLTADKRHDLLLDIWNLSDIHRHGWKLKIIGKGECESDLRMKIDALGVNKSVVIAGPTSRIQEEYLKSSIFLLTSRAEGFGLVLAEAMAFGIPCISFQCPSGPRDIVDDGISGRLVKEGDIESYVEALRQLATNQTLRLKLGRNSKKSSLQFHPETVRSIFMKAVSQAFINHGDYC